MFSTLLYEMFKIAFQLVAWILNFIETTAQPYLPDYSTILGYFNNFINYVIDFIPWIKSWFNIPSWLLGTAIDIIVGSIIVKYVVHAIKLSIAWYQSLKIL